MRDILDTVYYITDGSSVQELEKVHVINDLGLIFDSSLSFCDHISQKINKTNRMIGIIKCDFIHMEEKNIYFII